MLNQEVISKLKSIQSRISLMESEMILESTTSAVKGKIEKDIKSLSEKELKVKSILGSKYNSIKSEIESKAREELYKLRSIIKREALNEEPNVNIFEKISKYFFIFAGGLINAAYYIINQNTQGESTKLHEETEESFKPLILFASVFISNSVASTLLLQLLIELNKNKSISDEQAVFYFDNIVPVVIGPIFEEYGKRAALNISRDVGYEYTKTFASIEAIGYIIQQAPFLGSRAFIIRLPAYIMHLVTVYIQDKISSVNDVQLRYISYMVGVVVHSFFNLIMNKYNQEFVSYVLTI